MSARVVSVVVSVVSVCVVTAVRGRCVVHRLNNTLGYRVC